MGQKLIKKQSQDASNIECVIGLLGDSMVGKTTLYSLLTQEKLPDTYSKTTSVEQFKIRNKYPFEVSLWDLVADEFYKPILSIFIKDIKIIVLMFSFDNRESFEHLDNWVNYVNEEIKEKKEFVLVGNKTDIEDKKVTDEEAKAYADKKNFPFVKMCCLNQVGIGGLLDTVFYIQQTRK